MIGPDSFLPQGEAVASLIAQARNGRMGHAVLISGEAGTGKWTLAVSLAATLLCQGEGKKPCGVCRACRQMEQLEHPDLIVLQKGVPIAPDIRKSMSVIPIGDIREMIRLTSMHALEGERQVVLIRHAEDMNEASENALLKTLEEPPEGVFFLLTAVRTGDLLPTIISRCRPVKLHHWGREQVEAALRQHGIDEDRARNAAGAAEGSIGEAMRLAGDDSYWQFREEVIRDFMQCPSRSDIFRISTRWKDRKEESDAAFSVIENILGQMMRASLGGSGHGEYPKNWTEFAAHATPEQYSRLFDGLMLARKRTQYAVNFQAVTEQLILLLMEAVSS